MPRPNQSRSRRLYLYCTPLLEQQVYDYARQHGTSLSDAMRRLLEDSLKEKSAA